MNDAPTFRCMANDCPLFGGIFLSGPAAPGVCALHFGAIGHDIVRITQMLQDWRPVVVELNTWRRGQLQIDPGKSLTEAWGRLKPQLADFLHDELAPLPGSSYAQWGHRLQRFLEARAKQATR